MSTRVRVDPRAADELEETADWYDRQRAGLGREPVLEVRAVDDHLVVIAVAHDRRRPAYWAQRVAAT